MTIKVKEIFYITTFWTALFVVGIAYIQGWLPLPFYYEEPYLAVLWNDDMSSGLSLFYILALFVILTKMVFVSYHIGRTKSSIQYSSQRESRTTIAPTQETSSSEQYQKVRERHQQEQLLKEQQIMFAVEGYVRNTMSPYMKEADLMVLTANIRCWQDSKDVTLSPTLTNGQLATLDLRHLAWNIGERFKWTGEQRAVFIKQTFPHEFRDSDVTSIRRNLRQQGNCVIKIDVPEKHSFAFHLSSE